MQTCFESRQVAFQQYSPVFASSFQGLPPSCHEASDKSDAEGIESMGNVVLSANPGLKPRVSLSEIDCLYLPCYRVGNSEPSDASTFPANLKPRMFHSIVLDMDIIEEEFFQFIKCLIWTVQIYDVPVVASRLDHKDILPVQFTVRRKQDILGTFLSGWELPHDEVKSAFGGKMQGGKKLSKCQRS
jgi:hypothetical protein